jgi:hypothetical protein
VSLLVAWLIFPLLMAALAYGCGLLVQRIGGVPLPGALLPPVGLATIVVAAQLATTFEATAKLAAPLVAVLAVAGVLVTRGRGPWPAPSRAELVAATAVFVVYAIPIVALGDATIAGYMKLEDGSTFLALADSALEHGRGLHGYSPTGYPIIYNTGDYPVGSLLPFAIGGRLLGQEIAWLFQPYLALSAAMLTLVLQALCAPLIGSPWRRAAVGFVAAQSALLFGFAMWGGVKELTGAWLIAVVAALLPYVTRGGSGWRALVPLAVATAATVCALSFGALAWLGVPFAVALVLIVRWEGPGVAVRRAALFVAVSVPLLLPALPTASIVTRSGNRSVLTSQADLGTLFEPLKLIQAAGVWLASDFRRTPHLGLLTLALILLVVGAAVAGAFVFVRRRAGLGATLYTAGALTGCAAIVSQASPWVDAKALATIAPLAVFLAMAAGAYVMEAGRGFAGWCVIALVAAGVLGSNALAYREVTLAPRDRLEELARIDDRFAGEGPTLLTRVELYGNRYFLRDMAPDNAAEVRWHHPIRLRDGRLIGRFRSVDLDQLALSTVEHYRLLVLRRSPVASRPPSNYRLAWRGRWYDVWRRAGAAPVAHLPFGDRLHAAAVPRCATLRRFAARHRGLALVAARAPEAVIAGLPAGRLPDGWSTRRRFPGAALASRSGRVTTTFELPHGGHWRVWTGGAVLGRLRIAIDGRTMASLRHRLNQPGDYEPVATAVLAGGRHRLTFDFGERLLDGINDHFLMGPVALSEARPTAAPTRISRSGIRSLCGMRLDWLEAVPD